MGWEKIPSGYIEIRPGVYERADNIKRTVPRNEDTSGPRKPERPVRHEPMVKDEGKKAHSGRVHIRVTRRSKRPTDPDNNLGKYFIDSLRYAGVLHDDTEKDVTIEMRQEKVREKEETVIELFHYDTEPVR